MRLSDGRVLDAALVDGFFAVTWETGPSDLNVAKVIGYTPDTVYETGGPTGVTTRPR